MTTNELPEFVEEENFKEDIKKQSAGEILREARERAGLSRQELAAQLKLSVRIVESLEQENYDALPSTVFVRGYLASFARQLNLDADKLLDAFCQNLSEENRTAVPPDAIMATEALRKDRFVRRWGTWLIFVVLIGLLLVWWQGETALRFWESDKVKSETPAESLKPLPGRSEGLPKIKATIQTMDMQKPLEVEKTAETPKQITPERVAVTEPAGQGDRLGLDVSADSWVEVIDGSGTRLVYRLVRAGESVEVGGQEPFRVILGYAPGVSMKLNGEAASIPKQYANGTADFELTASAAN